jgi:hypothetical protein
MMTILTEQLNIRITDSVAVGALTSPLWLSYLEHVSTLASSLLPVFGIAWLTLQIITHWRTNRRLETYARKEGIQEGRKEVRAEIIKDADDAEVARVLSESLVKEIVEKGGRDAV